MGIVEYNGVQLWDILEHYSIGASPAYRQSCFRQDGASRNKKPNGVSRSQADPVYTPHYARSPLERLVERELQVFGPSAGF